MGNFFCIFSKCCCGHNSKSERQPLVIRSQRCEPNRLNTFKIIGNYVISIEPSSCLINATNLDSKTTIIAPNGINIEVEPGNIEMICELGRGAYGIVERVKHKPSGFEMAVKRIDIYNFQEQISSTLSSQSELKSLLMDMNVLIDSVGCPNIVTFYGAIFWERDLWLFMEMLDSSLDKFYRLAYKHITPQQSLENVIPEHIIGKIAASVVKALHYLYGKKIIHRDVKPSNILINRKGDVKLCDFGISGHLVNSMAKTNTGCQPYMAPERIDSNRNRRGYDIRSDVWSFGLSMLEIAIGRFPFPKSKNIFEQIKKVCLDEPPRLPPNKFSNDFENFINQCLKKEFDLRPNYATLLHHDFIKTNENNDISNFVTNILDLSLNN